MRTQPSASTRLKHQIAAITSGFLGDWLEQRGNPLAQPMTVHGESGPVVPAAPAITAPRSTLVMLVHGLTEMETIWDYPGQPGFHYATGLAPLLGATPLRLRYNTGLAIHHNGAALAQTLATLVRHWPVPVERLILMGHSMGGLVIRSACETGREQAMDWTRHVESCVYIGSPHDGSWLARLADRGAGVMGAMPRDYLRVISDVINLRSEGIRDLNEGHVMANRTTPPLLPSAKHYAVAGLLARDHRHPVNRLIGDALVHEDSARGAKQSGWRLTDTICLGGVDHIRLTHHPAVYRQLRNWLT